MELEISIYLAIALILNSLRRVISGIKNGAFYSRHTPNQHHELIKPYVENLHRAETPNWYFQFGGLFLLSLACYRAMEFSFWGSFVISYVLTMASSGAAGFWYQGFINIGSGLPWVDANENKKSEFAFRLFGKNFSFWWPRPWYGKRRLVFSVLSIITMILLVFMSIKFGPF